MRDREHPFGEDLITDGAAVVDPQLPVLAKVSCLVDALRPGGSYELVEKLWAQFVLTAGQVNTEVVWTRDEVLVVSVKFRSHFVSFQIYIVVLNLVNHLNRNATTNSVTHGGWAKAHHLYSLEFEARGVTFWAFIRTWEKETFRWVAVAVLDRFSRNATHKLSVHGSVVASLGDSASLVAVFGGWHVLADTFGDYL